MMEGLYEVRPTTLADTEPLPRIEVASGELFRTVGLDAVADSPPTAPEVFAAAHHDGRLWVAVAATGEVVAFALGVYMDGHHHLQQLSVLPDHGRRGLGRALIEAVCVWARDQGGGQVTLSTFSDVPWNGPYYERLGFRPLAEWELGPDLATARVDEQAQGLDISKRMMMRRDV